MIQEPVYISRSTVDENGTKIYKNCRIEDSSVADHVVVGECSVLLGATMKAYSQVNRFSMVRHSVIGDYSYAGKNFMMISAEIGRFSSISWNVTIGGADHDYSKVTTHSFLYHPAFDMVGEGAPLYDRFADDCVIGNDVWMGAGSVVKRGVTVGDGAVVGANAVVTHDVAPYTVVAGAPARIIRARFDDRTIERLLRIRWWDLDPALIREHVALFNESPTEAVLDRLEEIKAGLTRPER